MNEILSFLELYSTHQLTLFCFSCTQHLLELLFIVKLFVICFYPCACPCLWSIFIFMTFRNHRQIFLCYSTSTSIADSENQIKKGNRNLESQQNDKIPRAIVEISIKLEKQKKTIK